MRVPPLASLPWLLLPLLPAAAAQDPGPDRPGVVAPFDGATLDGWSGDARFWSVQDGCLVGRSTEQQPCDRTTYLTWTGGTVADFELTLEFRLRGGNSGVQFRSRALPEHQVAGYQADLEDGTSWTGCLYEQDGRGVLVTRGQALTAVDGERHVLRFAPDAEVLEAFRRGEWNRLRVRAEGPRVRIFVNDVLTCELLDGDPEHARAEGVLALQLHAGPPMEAAFRDLELEHLPRLAPGAIPVVAPRPVEPDPASDAAVPEHDWPAGRWIWADAPITEDDDAWFRRDFPLDALPEGARLVVAADDRCEVWLNGELVGRGEEWFHPLVVDPLPGLRVGRNLLAIHVHNGGSAAGLNAELRLTRGGATRTYLTTDRDWFATDVLEEGWTDLEHPDGAWGAPVDLGGPDANPWMGFRDMLRDLVSGELTIAEFEESDLVEIEFEEATSSRDAPFDAATAGDPDGPRWIWTGPESADSERAWFRQRFELEEAPVRASLFGTCDNACRVHLDGERVALVDDWAKPFRRGLDLGAGAHVLAVFARNDGGPAGLYLALELEYADGRREVRGTDDTWRVTGREPGEGWTAADHDDGTWGPPVLLGGWGVGPWGSPTASHDGSVPEATPAEAIRVPDGFVVERLYSVPKDEQGSWVCVCEDDRGRLITSDQYGGLYRVTPPPFGSDEEPEVEPLGLSVGSAQGLCHAYGALYVVVSIGDSGLYRVRDTDGDDRYDEVEKLRALGGVGEHGPHAVLPDPGGDGLWVLAGNHVPLPDFVSDSRVPRVWAEDQLLPRLPDANGHARGVMAPGGWVARVDRDGEHWELIACGMRNAYDLDFAPDGTPFTFDADMEWDVGLPWYRPTRVHELASGADYGWRHGSGKWPAYYEDSAPATLDLGLGSPTGVVFAQDAAFPGRWREAFLVADWAYGKVHAVFLEPDGAGWRGRSELFAEGTPFQVTDMVVGGDGALYLLTGGRRTQGGLYRIRCADDREPGPAPRAAARDAVALERERLEALHGVEPSEVTDVEVRRALLALASDQRDLRYAARTLLEHLPPARWADAGLTSGDPRLTAHSALAVARVGDATRKALAEERLLADGPGSDATTCLTWLRAWQVLHVRLGEPGPEVRTALLPGLEELERACGDRALSDAAEPLDRALAHECLRLMVALASPRAAARGMERLTEADTQEEALFHAFALQSLEDGWTPELQQRYFVWISTVGLTMEGGASLRQYVRNLRDEAAAHLDDAARQRLARWLDHEPASTAAPVEASFVQSWSREELEPLLGRLTSGRDFERGRVAYTKARCIECHRMGGEGGATGHDLTGAGARYSPRDLLEAILEPSKEISDQYQDTEVLTTDDELFIGKLEVLEDGTLVVHSPPPDEASYEIPAGDVALRRPHPLSRMPVGLLDVLERGEVLDLLAYVLAGGEEGDARFR